MSPDPEPTEPCVSCGRPLSGPRLWVHVSTGGGYLPLDAADHPNSQGMFPIGSECVKRLPEGVGVARDVG